MAEIAPWLKPTDTLGAITAGASAGLALRQHNQSQQEAADRLSLAYSQLASQEQRADMAARAKRDLAGATLALRGRQLDNINSYHQGQLDARSAADALRQSNMERLGDQFQQREQRLGDQFSEMLTRKAQGREYGEPEFFDIPGVPGAKGVFRKGSPGLHVVNAQKPPATSGLDTQRLRAAGALPKMIAQLADMDPASPEYAAGTNSVAIVQDYLKRTAPGQGAATAPAKGKAPKGVTHRFDPQSGEIVPIGADTNSSAAAALLDQGDGDEED